MILGVAACAVNAACNWAKNAAADEESRNAQWLDGVVSNQTAPMNRANFGASNSDFYGATDTSAHSVFNDWSPVTTSNVFDDINSPYGSSLSNTSSWSPSFNIDGTPMIGDSNIDIHGHPYGVTDSSFDSFSSSSSMFSDNSFGSSDSFSSSSSFSNDW
ncbi:MAG: hypothetical protein IPH37_14195 [Burkholderiales bacterium]|nr:hypothetical protein [Burkholderiales bacterium]